MYKISVSDFLNAMTGISSTPDVLKEYKVEIAFLNMLEETVILSNFKSALGEKEGISLSDLSRFVFSEKSFEDSKKFKKLCFVRWRQQSFRIIE